MPAPGTTFQCEDGGYALVLASASDDRYVAMVDLITYCYGGTWPAGNVVLAEAAATLRVETWRSCTKSYRESMGVDDEWSPDWWAPDGDGARSVVVAYYDGDAYGLGERAARVEVSA